MKYQVTVKHWVSYDVEVEAEDFGSAAALGAEFADKLDGEICDAVTPLVPEACLTDNGTEVLGIFKQ